MKKVIILTIILALTAAVFYGCTENFKQDPIAGPVSFDAANVISNGGLAVQASDASGKYLYYINGYAGATEENLFGKTTKGALLRVAIKEDGTLDYDRENGKPVIIVPKNVYGTTISTQDSSGNSVTHTNKGEGIIIDGEYLYYTSSSTKKNSSGAQKTDQMVIMRTKLDGTDTEEIAAFDDFQVMYKVSGDYLLYYNLTKAEIHRIYLPKGKDTLLASSVTKCVFTEINAANTHNVWAFYSVAAEDTSLINNIIYKVSVTGDSEPSVLINGKTSYSSAKKAEQIQNAEANEAGFYITLLDAQLMDGGVRLIYAKTDSGNNTLSNGIYLTELGANVAFDEANEQKLSNNGKSSVFNDAYTSFYFIDNNTLLAKSSAAVQYYQRTNGVWEIKQITAANGDQVAVINSVVTILKYAKEGTNGVLYYLNSSNKMQKRTIAEYQGDGSMILSSASAVDIISSLSISSTWLPAELIGDNIYYFNSSVSNYTYAYYLNSLVEGATVYKQENAKNKFISIATDVDKATLIA